ncbi:hypothetical protein LR48_Vigan04g078500 [Vigna angularis]|uniref:Uncharacterized protein n=1 Tax=Phaseolus angularis TaxID=3914 RepID=A0A0L9UDG2_PHAAN|nr:hypothetical protein LR48_Vigan04g078500 [Vigna angularis]
MVIFSCKEDNSRDSSEAMENSCDFGDMSKLCVRHSFTMKFVDALSGRLT